MRRTLRIRVIAAVVVLAMAGMSAVWIRHTWGTLVPWLDVPSKLNVFGRDYRGPGAPETRAALAATYPDTCLDFIVPPPLWIPLLLPANPCGRHDVVPTIVWLQVGPDDFRAYGLSGGP